MVDSLDKVFIYSNFFGLAIKIVTVNSPYLFKSTEFHSAERNVNFVKFMFGVVDLSVAFYYCMKKGRTIRHGLITLKT